MKSGVAFVFPGQGSQFVGMGLDFFEKNDSIKALYREASEVLGYDIAELCFSGPKEELNKTMRTQPAILLTSIACYTMLAQNGLKPVIVAGHSLGEYSALVAAGVLTLMDALSLTEKRGVFMQEAVPQGEGLMAVIIGLDRETVERICLEVSSGYVSPANYNCPMQIVIAGEKKAVEEAIKLAKDNGARRAAPLQVSVPSHCTLMVGASERLGAYFENVTFSKPSIPIVNNANAMILSNVADIKSSLVRHLNSPLMWEDSIKVIVDTRIDTFLEVGPGTVLSGLIKRINPNVRIVNVQDMESLESAMKALGE